jgi:hypothetical protein
MISLRKILISIALAGAVLPAAALAAATLPQYSKDKSLGVASCASSLCNGAVETWKDSNVLQNEYVTWSRSDKHARSYAVLLNDRSKEIAKKLGMKEAPHKADLCLDCHTYNPPPPHRGEGFLIADGIACEACHGPAERWIKGHVEPKANHAGNVANGMYPTNDDVARAKLCLSCHLGNEQKFVTHKIMAAGHPRMSFELDTFTQIGPAHFRIDDDWRKRKGSWDGVRAWAIGQAVAAQDIIGLLLSPRGRDDLFPELVLFDCHSCHHPMADKRNTAARWGAGPGIVRLNDASLLMLRQIARRVDVDGAAAFAQQVERLHRAVASGDDTMAQARGVQEMIAGLIPKISAHGFSVDDVRGILGGLIDDGLAGQYGDYQGAEQAAMALQSVADFMARRGMLRPATVKPAMTKLLSAVANDEKYRPAAFEQALRDLKTGVETGATK